MWHMLVSPFGSDEFVDALSIGYEPFATALVPAPSSLVGVTGSNGLNGLVAMVSLRIWLDVRDDPVMRCP
jgi:hypothetical protein